MAKRKVIKAFIKMQRVDVVCLQETKITVVSKVLIRSSGVGRFLEWVALRAEGASRGIIIFWDSHVIQLLDKEAEGLFSISCRFRLIEDEFTWVFTGVYAPLLKGVENLFGKSWGLFGGAMGGFVVHRRGL